MSEIIRIGIVISDKKLPAWQYSTVEKLTRSKCVSIEMLIILDHPIPDKKLITPDLPGIIHRFHEKVDLLIFHKKRNYSEPIDISNLLADIPEFRITDADSISEISEINKAGISNPDLIVMFTMDKIPPGIREIAGLGVLSYPMSEKDRSGMFTAGFQEVIRRMPVTLSTLVMNIEGVSEGKIIASTFEPTCRYSVNLTRNRIFWRSSLFMQRVIENLSRNGMNYIERLVKKNEKVSDNRHEPLPEPSVTSAIKDLAVAFKIAFLQAVKKMVYSDAFNWVIYYKISDSIQLNPDSFKSFKKLRPGKDRFWADPFVIEKEGKYYVFVEEFIYSRNKGHIAVLELDSSGNLQTSSVIIDMPYHMSYPFVFKTDGTYYMIPETLDNMTIDLYRCTDFPYKWEYVKCIMDGISAADTSVIFHNGRWWLFTAIDETDGRSGCDTELYLYYANDILAPQWTPHPENPVISDVRKSRPAGRVFINENIMYRPSQDCSIRYGSAFNLNRILSLDEERYQEELVYRIEPEWDRDLRGAHTFNYDGGMTVIDGYYMRRRPLFKAFL
ncbi:MAG: hypothetical protein WCE64_13325 [Bacteroidales bacterium]